ncbi:MAPEG family protein [Neptunicella sp. SCSIO 80796]|uniref:MAPEG family protein n=1 Tax=Neptunicella plasticusilytica TaxID=3117012 RepID=UPI003A4D28C1
MQTILICLFIAVLLPVLTKLPLAIAQGKDGGYDNQNPRGQQARLTGFGARAKASHENSFEALIMFAPGVVALVGMAGVTHTALNYAFAWVAARVAYHICYLINLDKIRSLFWAISYTCSLLILWEAFKVAGMTLE